MKEIEINTNELPEFVKEINKKAKTTKITTLDRAKALELRRFFSGSYLIDYAIGGGYAYKRILMLYGARSSGKNAMLNQMVAHNQRICRNCFGILPEFFNKQPVDRWTLNLLIQGLEECKCKSSAGKRIIVFDFEKTYAMEGAKTIKVKKLTYKTSGEEVDELDYNDLCEEFEVLKSVKDSDEEQKKRMKELDKFFKSINIEELEVKQMSTKDYLYKCGVLTNQLLIADPADTEEGIDTTIDVIKSREVDAIIWDSLQAAVPRFVKDRDADQDTMGVEAKKNGLLMRQVCSAFAAEDLENEREAYRAPVFITSQVRSKIGGFHSVPDGPSGGHAVHHHASLELEIKREHFLREDGTKAEFGGDLFGQKIRLRVEKSKLNAPSGMYELDYYFRDSATNAVGIDHMSEIVFLGVRTGIVERAGAWYAVDKNNRFQGMEQLMDFFKNNPDQVGIVYKKMQAVI